MLNTALLSFHILTSLLTLLFGGYCFAVSLTSRSVSLLQKLRNQLLYGSIAAVLSGLGVASSQLQSGDFRGTCVKLVGYVIFISLTQIGLYWKINTLTAGQQQLQHTR